ncbi:hypothetical protein EJMOOK_13615 [Rhodanobacter sp. Root179]|uniref:hypothetical protein n=1 Tax=Rhodanobacter sp. Root179 TaxID=1736482 RepID=UPI0007002BD7|nr:hypothetical protein [Rhodanobacter sp. Root179]KRB51225.1 hypothetical protein ASD82_04020 [Rhodanobacter sp. Root179]
MNIKRLFGVPLLALLLTLLAATSAWAATTVTYTGQGFSFDGTNHNLNDQRCGLTGQDDADDGNTGQFADWHGPGQPYQTGDGYLVWVLTANGATSATLVLPDKTVQMIKVGGTFKFASAYYSYQALVGTPVTASYTGTARGNVQLVVSHGCQPLETDSLGAWCSPGYWRNASSTAWTLIGTDQFEAFNDTVVPGFYNTPSLAGPTLIQVLTTPGANTFGAAAAPYGLNAFNATGAYLTNRIPGFHFDVNLVGNENACPIDNHGHYKIPE